MYLQSDLELTLDVAYAWYILLRLQSCCGIIVAFRGVAYNIQHTAVYVVYRFIIFWTIKLNLGYFKQAYKADIYVYIYRLIFSVVHGILF